MGVWAYICRPPDAVDGLDAGVLAVEGGVLAPDPVLRHHHSLHPHRRVGRGRVQRWHSHGAVRRNVTLCFTCKKLCQCEGEHWQQAHGPLVHSGCGHRLDCVRISEDPVSAVGRRAADQRTRDGWLGGTAGPPLVSPHHGYTAAECGLFSPVYGHLQGVFFTNLSRYFKMITSSI